MLNHFLKSKGCPSQIYIYSFVMLASIRKTNLTLDTYEGTLISDGRANVRSCSQADIRLTPLVATL